MPSRSPVPAALGDEPRAVPRAPSASTQPRWAARAHLASERRGRVLVRVPAARCATSPTVSTCTGGCCAIATREAIKLDQQARRAVPLPHGAHDHRRVEPADERARPEVSVELLAAREAVAAAGMTAREWRIVGLHAIGLSYTEVSRVTGDSARTVERQLLRGRHKLRAARARQGG